LPRPMPSKETCGVSGCGKDAVRSVALDKAKAVLASKTLEADFRRVHLCRDHYRDFRKATKKDRELDRLGW
jgi:hypothetical protein